MDSIKNKLEKAQNTFFDKVEAVAKKFRKEIIIPICNQHGMCFYSGMGHFFFDKDGGVLTPDYSPKKVSKYDLDEVFEILQLEVVTNKKLGEYVSDYIPTQKRKHYRRVLSRSRKRVA